jgi:hypothetical protein
MSEQVQLTPEQIAALQAELATLKQAHAEVLTKRQKDKSKIVELESATADLQGKLTVSAGAIQEITVGGPLKQMAESMSQAPELWLEQFSKYFKVEMVNGTLTLLNVSDGRPVIGKDANAVPFERDALAKLLTEGNDARAKSFQAITITNRASGAISNSRQSTPRAPAAARPGMQFGLR